MWVAICGLQTSLFCFGTAFSQVFGNMECVARPRHSTVGRCLSQLLRRQTHATVSASAKKLFAALGRVMVASSDISKAKIISYHIIISFHHLVSIIQFLVSSVVKAYHCIS